MKPVPQYSATVEQQLPATDGKAHLIVVGSVSGTHDECWQQARKIVAHPVITFRELKDVHHGQKC